MPKVKFLAVGRWAEMPDLRLPEVEVEEVGEIRDVSDRLAVILVEAGRAEMYTPGQEEEADDADPERTETKTEDDPVTSTTDPVMTSQGNAPPADAPGKEASSPQSGSASSDGEAEGNADPPPGAAAASSAESADSSEPSDTSEDDPKSDDAPAPRTNTGPVTGEGAGPVPKAEAPAPRRHRRSGKKKRDKKKR